MSDGTSINQSTVPNILSGGTFAMSYKRSGVYVPDHQVYRVSMRDDYLRVNRYVSEDDEPLHNLRWNGAKVELIGVQGVTRYVLFLICRSGLAPRITQFHFDAEAGNTTAASVELLYEGVYVAQALAYREITPVSQL